MENSGAAWYPAQSTVLKPALGEDSALWSWSKWSFFRAVQAQMSKLCEGKWRILVIPRAYNFLQAVQCARFLGYRAGRLFPSLHTV